MSVMKKLLPLVMLLMTATAANAGGLVTKHSSSVQLTVDAARSTATRLGSSLVSQVQILILRTDQLLVLYQQALSPLVYTIQELLLLLRTLQVQRSALVNLTIKLTHCLQVLQQ